MNTFELLGLATTGFVAIAALPFWLHRQESKLGSHRTTNVHDLTIRRVQNRRAA